MDKYHILNRGVQPSSVGSSIVSSVDFGVDTPIISCSDIRCLTHCKSCTEPSLVLIILSSKKCCPDSVS